MVNHGGASDVLTRLARVTDPELDEPVTELGFVTGVAVDAQACVTIGFRLPTYWCAANFAFLMADDMRREVGRLPWVRRVRIELGEHMYADTINRAMALGQPFREAFGDEADDDLDAVRLAFQRKSFQRRQLAVIETLLQDGQTVDAALGMTVGLLQKMFLSSAAGRGQGEGGGCSPEAPHPDPLPQAGEGDDRADAGRLVERYLERREAIAPAGEHDPAFVDVDGHPLVAADFPAYRRMLRRVAVNVEFNGALCRGLLAARFGEDEPCHPTGEPTLLDFVRGVVPERPAHAR